MVFMMIRCWISHTQSRRFISFQNTQFCFSFVGSTTPHFFRILQGIAGATDVSNFLRAFLMVSLNSQVRCFFSLLSEQWRRERLASGVVTDLRVVQVRGPGVAGGPLDEKNQWSLRRGCRRRIWARNLWEVCCRPKCLTPHSRKRTGILSEPTHIEGEDED